MSDELEGIRRSLPLMLRRRLDSIGQYVEALIVEKSEEKSRRPKIGREDLAAIKLGAFVYALSHFLHEGTKAAEASIQTLRGLKVDGFDVGKTEFREGNENTLRGRILADALLQSLAGTPIPELVKNARSMSHLVEEMRSRLARRPLVSKMPSFTSSEMLN